MVQKYFKMIRNKRKYRNTMESMHVILFFEKIAGLSVFTRYSTSDNRIVSKFSCLGLTFFLLWPSIYFYCTFVGYIEDQSIVRIIYDTKLKHFGDMLDRVATFCFILYSMVKMSFLVPLCNKRVQQIFDIDNDLRKLDACVDYRRYAIVSTIASITLICVTFARLLSVWLSLTFLNLALPVELIYQTSFSDMVVTGIASHHVFYAYMIKQRYQLLNDMLNAIKNRESWQNVMLVRDKWPVHRHKTLLLQDKHICERIRACAKIYSYLRKGVDESNSLLGFPLLFIMTICSFYIILYLFYFMEVTATGLFHDDKRYKCFLLYVFWRIAYALGVIFANIYISEVTVDEVSIK